MTEDFEHSTHCIIRPSDKITIESVGRGRFEIDISDPDHNLAVVLTWKQVRDIFSFLNEALLDTAHLVCEEDKC